MERFPLKVGLLDSFLVKDFLEKLSLISLFLGLLLIFVDIPIELKRMAGFTFLLLLVFLYLMLWISANVMKKKTLKMNGSMVAIKEGDLFQEEGLKVIAFNEYFDTEVNNRLISDKTLNGIFIREYLANPKELDLLIEKDIYLQKKILENNVERLEGKRKRYRLGAVYKHEQFLLTAFARFDQENRAFLRLEDYLEFLMNFWDEVDAVYNGESVVLPLLGSGITRFKEHENVSEQELLELLLWTFKVSRIKFTSPSKLTIVIHPSRMQKIDLYRLKDNLR